MKAIYTRTIGVYDNKLNEAMEISKGLAEVRKKHYPDHEVYFSFQVGGNPRTVRETLIGEQEEKTIIESLENLISRKPIQSKIFSSNLSEIKGGSMR